MVNKKIVMLAGEGYSTNILYNAMNVRCGIDAVIIDGKENRKKFLQRRIKKLGIICVIGQVLFQLIIVKILAFTSKKRINNIIQENNLNISPIPTSTITRVDSVNDNATIELIRKINPGLIIINGTRILSKKLLQSISCQVINMHTGITPMYRGVHGGYWALVKNDKENCGVTVHLVDSGIDTGQILYQDKIEATPEDNFITYPYLQIAKAVPLLEKATNDALHLQFTYLKNDGTSHLWYHPTIWEYIYYRLFRYIK